MKKTARKTDEPRLYDDDASRGGAIRRNHADRSPAMKRAGKTGTEAPPALPAAIETIVAEARMRLHDLYADSLLDIILFGSYARGDYSQGSDLDLLLLFKTSDDYSDRERYLRLAADLSLKYDTLVSLVPMDYATFQSRTTPLILNIRHEGVPV